MFAYLRDFLHRSISINGTLSCREQRQRMLFFKTTFAGFCFLTLQGMLMLTHGEPAVAAKAAHGFMIASSITTFGVIFAGCHFTEPILVLIMLLYFFGSLFSDLHSRTMQYSSWPGMLLSIDIMIMMELKPRYVNGAVILTLFWFILMAIEEQERLGLFDLEIVLPEGGMEDRRWFFTKLATCKFPPCRSERGIVMTKALTSIFVFSINFVAMGSFAKSIRKEQDSMCRTIAAVQEIATCLAGYDVEKVATLLQTHQKELPGEMLSALCSLKENLMVYKAYLPKTCLRQQNKGEEEEGADNVESLSEEQTSSSGASSVASTVSHGGVLRAVLQPISLRAVKATLLVVNVQNTVAMLESDVSGFSQLFTQLLQRTLKGCDAQRGMVDVFVGDRIFCSFNTSKPRAAHASSALHTAAALLGNAVNIGVATGKVLCGDMGCEVMRRFSMVGQLCCDVVGMERAGRTLGCGVLCNRLCFSDGECEHQLRIVPWSVELSAGRAETVAELMSTHPETAAPVDEWMYQIGRAKPWDPYNEAVKRYLKEDPAIDVEQLATLWEGAGGVGAPQRAVPQGSCRRLRLYVQQQHKAEGKGTERDCVL